MIFPNIGDEGVDFLITNPPYSKKQNFESDLFNVRMHSPKQSTEEVYPLFIKMLFDLTKNKLGGGGVVVPLSLVASTKDTFRSLRSFIQNRNGKVEFWNFDRTPDSLFGDDVKTRNTILFFTNQMTSNEKIKISSSFLHRWNSRNRDRLFTSISLACLKEGFDISIGVPKVGDELGVHLLSCLNENNLGSLSEIIERSESSRELCTKSTAYNWLPVILNFNSGITNMGNVGWRVIRQNIPAAAIYAVMNSRMTYWLWRLWSDGFHLTNQFIYSLPYGAVFFDIIELQRINELGLDLWAEIQNELIVTKNAGMLSYSHCPLRAATILDEIDSMIISAHKLPNSTATYLRNHINRLILAGRENEPLSKNKSKYLELIN